MIDSELKQAIDRAEVISFDIFDTLISRMTARPEDIFRIVGLKTGIRGFAKKRERAQTECSRKAEQSGRAHCTFDEIYTYMKKDENVKRAEIDTEREFMTAMPTAFAAYEYALSHGKRIIAISDMYFGKAWLLPLLESCGYAEISEIYSSADIQKTKYRGDIYDYVRQKEGKKILHIGDNLKDDIENACAHGFEAYHIPSGKTDEYLSLTLSISRGVSAVVKNGDIPHDLGASVGGLLYCRLILGLRKIIDKYQPEKVFFLSRDGYDLYGLMSDELECEYLLTSRRALLLCGIEKIDDDAKRILPPFTYGQTVGEILSYLDIDIPLESVKKAGLDGFESLISTPDDMERFKKIYEYSSDVFLKKCAEERENFRKYIEKTGLLTKKALIFDCGWNGSSQYLLDRALKTIGYKGENRFVYAGILPTRKSLRQLNGKKYDTLLFDKCGGVAYRRLRRSIVLLELFFGAPHASVWKYAENGVLYEPGTNDLAFKTAVFDGISDFVAKALPLFENMSLSLKPKDCLAEVFRLTEHPTVEEAVLIGDLENVDGFAAKKGKKKYIAYLTDKDILDSPNELYWPQGIYTRPDISAAVKAYVSKKTGVKMTKQKKRRARRPNVFARVWGYTCSYGIATTAFLIKNKLSRSEDPYRAFIENAERDIMKTTELAYRPLFSFVVPVYNMEETFLRECIESVLSQTYDNWELILADDASTDENVRRTLSEYEGKKGVKVIYRSENGHISRCTNTAIEAAKGEYIVFLDCDDTVSPNAVYELTKAVNADKTLDFIYSDEDKTDENGSRCEPHFKPDYSPDTLMSLMYTSHLSAYRRSIVNEVGGLRVGFEGAQDYDLTLRFTEKTNRVGHIPKILYHWRIRSGSTSLDLGEKPYVMQAVEKAKKEALARRGQEGSVELVPAVSQFRVVYKPANEPLVSIIIPSKDNFDMLSRCLDSVVKKTVYKNFEIVVVDNGSADKEKYSALCKKYNAEYCYKPMKFNFSKMCNIGAELAKGNYLLFLNDDTEVLEGCWLGSMLGQAALPHSGAVGAKLLYPDSTTIQHCGILNLPIGPCHALTPLDDRLLHYYCRNSLDYNCIAVTAACLCVNKEKFRTVGGFDESFDVAYNDIDLCFALYEAGYYNCVRTDAVLYHYESVSRGSDNIDPEKQRRLDNEKVRLYQKHPQLSGKDPFYNINLAKNRADFALAPTKTNKVCGAGVPVEKYESDRVKACLESVDQGEITQLRGFAYIDGMPLNNLNTKNILLIGEDGTAVAVETDSVLRFDVSAAYGRGGSLNLSGFECRIDNAALQHGRYRVGIMLENLPLMKRAAYVFDKYLEI